jgi:hypothetical protein
MKNKLIYIIAVIIFVVGVGGSYLLFSKINKPIIQSQNPVKKLANGLLQFDTSLPKTESCPLNGAKYSTQQRDWWQQHEPLGVMIENSSDARPQSGISYADVVYEAVAEGGITRTLDIFYCQDAPQVGPVRSARIYFLDQLRQYGQYPLYAHVGGANADGPADALGEIDTLGWTEYNDLNQFSLGYPTFWRDYDRLGHTVATEHTMYSTTTKLWDVAKSRGITNVTKAGPWDKNFTPYTFKDDPAISARPASQKIHIEFWGDAAYNVDWSYDKQNNVYLRNNGGAPHIDRDTNKQLTAKDVVVLYMKQSNANDGYENNEHLLYQDTGTGKAVVFMDGKQIKATWKKASATARLMLYDENGNPVTFNRGQIWFTILPLDGKVNVQ